MKSTLAGSNRWPRGSGSKTSRSLASIAALSKSPETETIMLLGMTVRSCHA